MHQELKRAGVTLQLLWGEYQEAARATGAEPINTVNSVSIIEVGGESSGVSLRQVHRGGEKAFVDYSGKKPCLSNSVTGEVRDVELFVMTLRASSYTYPGLQCGRCRLSGGTVRR